MSFIRRARELGFGTAEVKALLGLAEPGRASCAEVRALTMVHLDDVRARISDLRRLEGVLSFQIAGEAADAIVACAGTSIFRRSTSLGFPESLIEHRRSTEGERSACPEALIRLSIGLEHAEDLIADLQGALKA